MAVEEINAAGGVNGQKLELLIGDDACDPKQATAVANKMVTDKVVFVAGHYCSSSSIPASDIYKEGKILQITPASTNPALTDGAFAKGNTTVFRTVGRDDIQGPTMANYILKAFPKAKVAIIHDKTTYGKGVADEAKKALNAGGMKEVMYEAINRGDKDFTALISKMKQAKIDVMILGGYHPEGAAIIKQSREQGLASQLVGFDALATDEFAKLGGCRDQRRVDVVPAQGRGRSEECRRGEEVPRRQVQSGGLHAVQLRRSQGMGTGCRQGQVYRLHGRGGRAALRHVRLGRRAAGVRPEGATSRTRSTTSTSGKTATILRSRSDA